MFSLTKMSAASEDYYLGLVQYYLGGRRRKRKKRRGGLLDDFDGPDEDAEGDGLAIGDAEPFSTAMPGEPPGWWFGQGAAKLGLQAIVREEPYRRVFRGYHPTTNEPLVQNAGAADRRPGWEACFSPPKDFSVLWSQAPPEIRRRLEELNWQAAEAALRYIEQWLAFSRAGKAGWQSIPVGLVIAIFEHCSSRALDPDLHLHAQLLNLGIDEAGQSRAIDPLPIFKNQQLLGALYRATLAASLRAEFGIVAEQHGRSFRIQGVPQDLVRQHSKRRQQILERLAERGERGGKAAARAALETRAKKDPLVSRDELILGWRETNSAAGFNDAAVKRLLRHGPRKPATTVRKVIREAVREMTRRKNHFTEQELLLQALWGLPKHGLDPAAVVPAIRQHLEQSSQIVPLGAADGQNRYTTKTMLREEQRMLTALERLAKRPGLTVSDRSIRHELQKRPTMRQEQADFVRHLTQANQALRIGLGFAGTGKTYALKTAVDAWKRQGYRVLAAAPTGQAARVLGREIGIECTTLTRLLGDYRLPFSAALSHHAKQLARAARGKPTRRFRQPRPAKITRKTVVLVDEAGMIGTRHMRMIAELVDRNGGTLCMVGDPAQLPAVETTSPLQSLTFRYGAARLTEIRRQKEAWAREAAQNFADGEPGAAMAMFAKKHRVTVRDNLEEAVQQACLDWTAEGLHTPHRALILGNTNELVETANRLCQEHRLRAGCIDASSSVRVTDEQDDGCLESNVHVGDRILCTRNSRSDGMQVENGTLGTVLAIRHFPPAIHAVLDDQRRVTLSVRSYPHIRLGYAVTTYRSQGASIPRLFVAVGGNLQNLPASYVQATRAIEDTSFYTTKDLLNPYLENVASSPLVEEMSRKPDLRLASDFLAEAPVELRPRRSRIRRVAPAPPAATADGSPRETAQPAAPSSVAESQPSPRAESAQPTSRQTSASQAAIQRPEAQHGQTAQPAQQATRQAPPEAQPAAAPFDGTYQRLRFASGQRRIANRITLVASCVDGGVPEHRHRPPPPRGMAMPFAAKSIMVKRESPTPSPWLPLADAHRRGMLTLMGTGCQDHVQVVCPAEEIWMLDVQDSLGLISPQDDIAAGLAFYNRPGILHELESLDRLDHRLREFAHGQALLNTLFACMRRQAAWVMPHVNDPAAVSREFIGRFCRMLFEDPYSRYFVQRMSRLAEPLEKYYTRSVLESCIVPPFQLPTAILDNLHEFLLRKRFRGGWGPTGVEQEGHILILWVGS